MSGWARAALTPTLSRGERERDKKALNPTLFRGERDNKALTPTLSRGEREMKLLTPAFSHRERKQQGTEHPWQESSS